MTKHTIAHEEVLRHIYAFLQSHGYKNAQLALQAESGVPYNTIHFAAPVSQESAHVSRRDASTSVGTPDGLARAVLEGKWSEVLSVYVTGLLLPENIKANLYELIFEELLNEYGLQPAARALLTHAPVFSQMKILSPARYVRLEHMLDSFDVFTWREAKASKASAGDRMTKREAVLKSLQQAITFTSEPYDGLLPAALLAALNGNPIATSRKHGRDDAEVSCTSTGRQAHRPLNDVFLQYPLVTPKKIMRKFVYSGEKAATYCVVVTVTARSLLLVGRADGVVDFVDPVSAEAVGPSVAHTNGVLSMALDVSMTSADDSAESIWVAVGYRDGWVKVYNVATSKLIRRFGQVHSTGVTGIHFHGVCGDPQLQGHRPLIVTGSYDGSVHLLSLTTGTVLSKVGDSHRGAYVNAVCSLPVLSTDGPSVVMSAGNDGTLVFWKVHDVHMSMLGSPMSLRAVHSHLRDGVPTHLIHVDERKALLSDTAEILILTRSAMAAVVSVDTDLTNPAAPVTVVVLCIVKASKDIRCGVPHTYHIPSLPLPMLTLYITDVEGTILLYNVEMLWRDPERRKDFGGSVGMTDTVDHSAAVVVDHGKAVPDMRLCCLWGDGMSDTYAPPRLICYASSLPAVYMLQ